MIRPLQPLKDLYSNMRLQSKFMITHLVLIIIPTIVIAYFFYGQMGNHKFRLQPHIGI